MEAHYLEPPFRRRPRRTLKNPSAWVIMFCVDAMEMGRRGGLSKSAAKRAAARRNGARGGRPRDADLFVRKVADTCARLRPQLPQMDPGDLSLIVRCLLLPPARRAVFLARRKDGRYVF